MIRIEKYEAVLENGRIRYYAIPKKGKKIEMPEAFKDMYDDDHLAIREVTSDMPEVFDIPEEKFFIPLRTTA